MRKLCGDTAVAWGSWQWCVPHARACPQTWGAASSAWNGNASIHLVLSSSWDIKITPTNCPFPSACDYWAIHARSWTRGASSATQSSPLNNPCCFMGFVPSFCDNLSFVALFWWDLAHTECTFSLWSQELGCDFGKQKWWVNGCQPEHLQSQPDQNWGSAKHLNRAGAKVQIPAVHWGRSTKLQCQTSWVWKVLTPQKPQSN